MAELSVRGETLQRLYNQYLTDRFQVNRRYQRKLVWSVEEKERLIDSISRDLPLPLFLVAEVVSGGDTTYELIDGMQRLNAVFAFFEQEFSLAGEYFDLDALADTKELKDAGALVQQQPVLSRSASVNYANYTVALSSFRAPSSASIDEVFRRINSGGRRLSTQELRQAGTISTLADLVRVVASRIRGDTSPGNIVPLRAMPHLSITNRDLPYGVNVDDIYWVSKGVLRREDLRQSADEQLILDLVIDCLIDPLPNSGPGVRNDYYNYSVEDEGAAEEAHSEITASLASYGAERFEGEFMRTYDAVRQVLDETPDKLTTVLGLTNSNRAPRYFHAIFIAFWRALGNNQRIKDPEDALSRLTGQAAALDIPSGGGDWRKDAKAGSIKKVGGLLKNSVETIPEGEDLAVAGFASALETILGNALVEQQTFECKQGFYDLSSERNRSTTLAKDLARTLSAMANMGPGVTGYALIGVADSGADAERIESLDGTVVRTFRGFRIVGIERETELYGADLSDYWLWIVQALDGALPKELKSQVTADARLGEYRGRRVALLKVVAGPSPVFFDGDLWERSGSRTVAVAQDQYFRVFGRFTSPPR